MRKILFLLILLTIPALLSAAEPVRIWTYKDGKTTQAAFDRASDTDPATVPLIKNGKKYKILLGNLSKADQDYVTALRQDGRRIDKDDRRNEDSRSIQVVPKSRRYALLIGVNEYARPIKSLQYCVNDMKLLAESFERIGVPKENIFLVTDDSPAERRPTGENIRHQIETVTQLMGQNDQLTIAFSGHGAMVDGNSYLCPSDTNLDNQNSIISRDWAFAQLEQCKAKQKVFIIDACRDEVSFGEQRALGGTKTLEDPIGADTHGFILIASCDKKQKSWEHSDLKHGVFTYFLAEGLAGAAKDEDGYVSIMNIFQYASSKTKKFVYREFNKAQVPTIRLRDEMTDFVIAKLDRAGLEVAVPQEVENVRIREYQVGSLKIKLQSAGSTLSTEKIQAGKIQLPPIPDKINELTGEVRGIQDALTRMENGTHEALREAQQAKTDAQTQYEAIKSRRDEEWKQLSPEFQYNLEQQIKESPDSSPTSFSALRPKNIGFSQFVKLILWGQKTEQARLEKLRVEKALKGEIQKEISRIKKALANKKRELQTETEKFRLSVVQFLLEQTPGWKKRDESEKLDYMFLSETIPALVKYPLGWDEESLFVLAEDIWKTKRPCVIEQEKTKREKQERERIAREKTEKAERERIAREKTEKAERERIAREKAEKAEREQIAREKTGREEALEQKAGERKTYTVNGVEFAFRWCPSGTFMMGTSSDESEHNSNEKLHKVTLTKGFWMMETEVTQKHWKAVMGNNPSSFKGDDLPVECVSWESCQDFCKKCKQFGLSVHLPTEAQWEYACRAGTTEDDDENLDEIAWYNGDKGTHPVGTKKPNAWGLYDMHGNVWEWCQDWYGDYPGESVTDPVGSSSGFDRIFRGGGWNDSARYCRLAYRGSFGPDHQDDCLGFRCVIRQ